MGNLKDYATSTVLTAPSSPTAGTSLVVQSGHGARFPAAPFYVTAHPPSEFPTLDVAEKLLVTAKSTDTFTITRAQGDTTAKSIEAGWRISNAFFFGDIPVVDATSVDAAGATMNTDTNVKTNSWVLDEDNMSSNVDTKVPTQQSVKAYVDAAIAALGTSLARTGDIWQQAGTTLPSGWLACDGTAISRTTYAALFAELVPSKGAATMTIAAPGVVTNTAHGIYTGEGVYFTTTGALPTGVTANTRYFAIRVDANTFRLATTLANAIAGTAITTTGSQSGTHTLWYCPWGNGDGTTTFNTPDLRDRTLIGKNTSGTFQALGKTGGAETHTLSNTELPNLNGNVVAHSSWSSFWSPTGVFGTSGMASVYAPPNGATGGAGSVRDWTFNSGGGGGAHNNLQPYAVINYRIKT